MKNRPIRLLSLALAVGAGTGLVAPRAQAQAQPQAQGQAQAQAPGDWPQVWQSPPPSRPMSEPPAPKARGDRWQIAAGGGAMWVGSAGLDPFSEGDAVGRFSLSVSGVAWRSDRLSLAAGLGLDTGTTSASARGASSQLGLTLFSAFAEGRYLVAPRLYAFGRLAPGIQRGSARLEEASAPGSTALTGAFTTAALAASAGAAFCVNGLFSAPGAWFIFDGGYLLAPARSLILRPDLGDDEIAQLGALDLGTIAPRGAFFRLSFALSY